VVISSSDLQCQVGLPEARKNSGPVEHASLREDYLKSGSKGLSQPPPFEITNLGNTPSESAPAGTAQIVGRIHAWSDGQKKARARRAFEKSGGLRRLVVEHR